MELQYNGPQSPIIVVKALIVHHGGLLLCILCDPLTPWAVKAATEGPCTDIAATALALT